MTAFPLHSLQIPYGTQSAQYKFVRNALSTSEL